MSGSLLQQQEHNMIVSHLKLNGSVCMNEKELKLIIHKNARVYCVGGL